MSAESQYSLLLEKIASKANRDEISAAHAYASSKVASMQDMALAAALGAVPAYLYGKSSGKDLEKRKHMNYALAGAGVGALTPMLLKAIANPSSITDSVSGFDADDIRSLKLEDIE